LPWLQQLTFNMKSAVMCREQVEQLQRLQRDVTKQVDTFQSLLTHRMTSTVTLTSSDLQSVNDLGSLGVIHEVSSLKLLVILGQNGDN